MLWLPFFFSDTKNGRHNGILPPQFGVGDIVRNSPSYRRNVEHVGYYWALNDYMDLSAWLDWRSAAGATTGDPGWLKYNADWNYRWLDRFLGGRVGLAYTTQRDGLTNKAISWSHQQDFSHDSHFNSNLNYVSSTTLQRQNTFNPYTALATISSQATYQSKLGPASFSIGATRKQYPGREQVDQTFPTLSLTSTAIGIGKWLTWTPSFSFNRSDVLHMDQPGIGRYEFFTDASGARDSVLSKNRSASNSSITFDTPIADLREGLQEFIQNHAAAEQLRAAVPDLRRRDRRDHRHARVLGDVSHGHRLDAGLLAAAARSQPLQPDAKPQPSERRSRTVRGAIRAKRRPIRNPSKRFTAGLSASPTLFGLFRGFGPFQRIRHQISPTIGYTFAPAADVSDEYLRALGRTRKGYLGSLMQNAITFGLTQNFEAKLKTTHDTTAGADEGKIVRLLTPEHDADLVRFRAGELADGAFATGGFHQRDVGLHG